MSAVSPAHASPGSAHGSVGDSAGRRIVRAGAVVAGMTALSRVFGFARSVVIAALFSTESTDAFWVAFRIPNLLRRLFAEGALTISFVPVFTEVEEREGRDEADRVAHMAFSFLAVIVGAVTLLGIALAPAIAHVFAPGFFRGADGATGALTIRLLRILFPYILLISLVALCQGVLNARRHFFAPAAAPVALNIVMIASALWLTGWFDRPIIAVAVGVIAGGVLQLLLQIPFLLRAGYRYRPRLRAAHPAVRKMLLLMGPAAFGLLVYQFNILISTILASLLAPGSVSYLFYANQLTELPLGIFAVAIGTVSLPTLSAEALDADRTRFLETFRAALGLVWFLTIPAAVGYFILSTPIVSVLFERGRFAPSSALATAGALQAFAIGLPAIGAVRVTAQAFYALQNTKTPVVAAFVAFLVNIPLSILLMGPGRLAALAPDSATWFPVTVFDHLPFAGHVGLALATACASIVNVAVLLVLLRRRLGSLGGRALALSVVKTVVAASLMGGVLVAYTALFRAPLMATGVTAAKLTALAGALLVGAGLYFLAAFIMRHEGVQALRQRRAAGSAR